MEKILIIKGITLGLEDFRTLREKIEEARKKTKESLTSKSKKI